MKTNPSSLPPRSLFGLFLLTALAGVIASCASVNGTATQYVGAPRFPASDPAGVQILRTAPESPHDRLGEIQVKATTSPAPPIAEVEEKLRQEAAKLGADAVVVIFDRIQPVATYVTGGYSDLRVDTISGRKLIGIAIKFRTS